MKKHLILSILACFIIVTLCALCGYQYKQNKLLQAYIDEQDARIVNLNDQILRYTSDEYINQRIADKSWLEIEEKMKEQKATAAPITSPSKNAPQTMEQKTCQSPGCKSIANYNSNYCSRHECFELSCHNPRANDFTLYCADHKCLITDCNRRREKDGFFCSDHSW